MIIKNRESTIKNIEGMSKRMKYHLLDTALAAGASSSHFGGGLSIIDITATLYGSIMKFNSIRASESVSVSLNPNSLT